MNEAPSSTTPPTTPGAPPTPSPAAPTSPGSPGSLPAPAPPMDPYLGLDYQGMLAEHDIRGMDAGELASVFGPAHEAINEVAPGLRGFFEEVEAGGTPIGNDPGLIRALGSYGDAYRGLKRDEQTLAADVRRLAAAAGVPVPPPPRVAPLQIGQGLREAVGRLLSMHVRDTSTQRLVKEWRRDPGFESELNRLAQEVHARSQRIQVLAAQREALQAKLEAPETLRPYRGARYSNEDLSIAYEKKFHEWSEADRAGQVTLANALKKELMSLAKARFGGNDAA